MTPDIIAALEAFAAYADPRRSVPASMPVTSGSSMARKQLTMGDCYAAADALAALSTSPAGQEVRGPTIGSGQGVIPDDVLNRIIDNPLPAEADEAFTIVWMQLEERGYLWSEGNVEKAHLGWLLARALSSVEPAGNGREVLTLKDVEAGTIELMEAASGKQGLSVSDWVAMRLREAAERALSSPPAADQEAVAYTGSGSLMALKDGREGFIWPTPADAHPIPLYATHPAPALDGVRVAAETLRKEAFLLLQNSEGCALNHYGHDAELFGMPGWLVDSRARIEAAAKALSSPSEGESAPASSGAGDVKPVIRWKDASGQIREARDSAGIHQAWVQTSEYASMWHYARKFLYAAGIVDGGGNPLISTRAAPLPHDAEGESATVSREGELREALETIANAEFVDVMCDPGWAIRLAKSALSTPATSTERGR